MSDAVQYRTGRASEAEIAAHLRACDGSFVPPLSERVDLAEYAGKIAGNAQRFEAWANGELVGLVAAYCNAPDQGKAFITSVSVLPGWQGRRLASRLMDTCIDYVRQLGFTGIELGVEGSNAAAMALYRKHGFAAGRPNGLSMIMTLDLSTPPI